MRQGRLVRASLITLIIATFCLFGLSAAQEREQKEKDTRPERGFAIYSEYSGIFVPPGEPVRMELTVENKGKRDEDIALKLTTVPKGWKASIKGPNYLVNEIPVPGGKSRTLTFSAEPEKGVKPETYLFQIDAKTEDGKFSSSQKIGVTVREKTAFGEDLTVTTSYPVLRGQTDSRFEFSLEINNKGETDRTINLAAQAPEKWETNFKPAYEQKQISSFRIKGGQNQTVAVEVAPPKDATSGTYPINVSVTSGEKKAEIKLSVILTGIYKLDAGTPTGLLSLDALTGKPANHVPFCQEYGFRREPQPHAQFVQARKLEGGIQAREDRCPGAGSDETGGGDDHPRRSGAGRRLFRGPECRWREGQQQDGRDPGGCENFHRLGLDRDRHHHRGYRRFGRPVRLAGKEIE